jgi:hypothetical protein
MGKRNARKSKRKRERQTQLKIDSARIMNDMLKYSKESINSLRETLSRIFV